MTIFVPVVVPIAVPRVATVVVPIFGLAVGTFASRIYIVIFPPAILLIDPDKLNRTTACLIALAIATPVSVFPR
jgi:hypothetical protein